MYLVVLGVIIAFIVMLLVVRYRSIREEHFLALSVRYPINKYEYRSEYQSNITRVCNKAPHLCRAEVPSDMLVFIDKNGTLRETDMPIDFFANCMTQATADTDCIYGVFGNMVPEQQLEFVNNMIQDVYDMDESSFQTMRNMITRDYKEAIVTQDNTVKLVTKGGVERVLSANETHIVLLAVYLGLLSRDQGLPMPTFDDIGDTNAQKNNLFVPRTNQALDAHVLSIISNNPTCDDVDDQLFDAYDAGSYNGAPITPLDEDPRIKNYLRNWHENNTDCTLDKLVQIGFTSPYNRKYDDGPPPGPSMSGTPPGPSMSGTQPGPSMSGTLPSPPMPGTQPGPPPGNDPSTPGELLVAKGWRSPEWATNNSSENHRNTLIVKLNNLSKSDPNSDELTIGVLQSMRDDELVQIGFAYPGNNV